MVQDRYIVLLKLNRKSYTLYWMNGDITSDLGWPLSPNHPNFNILRCLSYTHSEWTETSNLVCRLIIAVSACSWQNVPERGMVTSCEWCDPFKIFSHPNIFLEQCCKSCLEHSDMHTWCECCDNSNHLTTHTHTTVLLLFWNMSGTTRVSRYQKGKIRKVKTSLDLLEQETVSGRGICWAICNAYSFNLLQGLPLCGDTWVHLIPHSTHPQSSSLHGAVKAGSLSEMEKRALPPACFPSFNFQSTRSQCSCRPDCTSSQVRCIPSQPDRLVTQSIATLLLSQGEPTVWSSKVSPCGRHMGSPPIVHTSRVPPCMAQSRLGAFPSFNFQSTRSQGATLALLPPMLT